MSSYRILFFNLQYFLGFDGSARDYIKGFHRLFFPQLEYQQDLLQHLGAYTQRENLDLCCFVEVPQNGLLEDMRDTLAMYPIYDVQNKYHPTSHLQKFRTFRTRGNGFFGKDVDNVKTHYFSCGTKRLIYELTLANGISVFMAHFSLRASVRKQQFEQIGRLVAGREKIVVCGDFNIFDGFSELQELTEATNLKIINQEHQYTFPRAKPKKCLSIFLCSPDILSASVKVVDDLPISDHLPVVLDMHV